MAEKKYPNGLVHMFNKPRLYLRVVTETEGANEEGVLWDYLHMTDWGNEARALQAVSDAIVDGGPESGVIVRIYEKVSGDLLLTVTLP